MGSVSYMSKNSVLNHLEREATERGANPDEYRLIEQDGQRVLIVAGQVFFSYGAILNGEKLLTVSNGFVTGEREIPRR